MAMLVRKTLGYLIQNLLVYNLDTNSNNRIILLVFERVGKAWHCKCYFKNCARERPNSGSKVNSTSIPDVSCVCMQQRLGVYGWEKKCKKPGLLRQRKLNRW